MRKIKSINKAQKRAKKIINKVSVTIVTLMFILGFNTVGGMEIGKITIAQGQRIIILAIAMILFNLAVFLLTKEDEVCF